MGRRLYFPNHDLALVVAHSDHPARRTRRHGLREQAVVPDSPDRHALDDAKMAFWASRHAEARRRAQSRIELCSVSVIRCSR